MYMQMFDLNSLCFLANTKGQQLRRVIPNKLIMVFSIGRVKRCFNLHEPYKCLSYLVCAEQNKLISCLGCWTAFQRSTNMVGCYARFKSKGDGSRKAGFPFIPSCLFLSIHFFFFSQLNLGGHTIFQALLSGCSAGGLASILKCDEFRELFPSSTKVKCLSDGGLFLDA